jgi:hypothetical protein
MSLDRRDIDRAVDEIEERLVTLSRRIHEHPELSFEERQASRWIAELVEEVAEVPVERPFGRMETALRARVGSGGGPRIALLAEYDALPEIGHACGHNLIAGAAVGRFSRSRGTRGPSAARWSCSGRRPRKPAAARSGLLEDRRVRGRGRGDDVSSLSTATCSRTPRSPRNASSSRFTALRRTRRSRRGTGEARSRRVSTRFVWWTPNASAFATACVCTVSSPTAGRLRTSSSRALSANSRSGRTAWPVGPVVAAVERCARAAALASEVDVEFTREVGYRVRNNLTLARRFGVALEALGQPHETDARIGAASTDMGDVDLSIPAIHPGWRFAARGEACHQRAFADCAKSEVGFKTCSCGQGARTDGSISSRTQAREGGARRYKAARSS